MYNWEESVIWMVLHLNFKRKCMIPKNHDNDPRHILLRHRIPTVWLDQKCPRMCIFPDVHGALFYGG